MITKGFSCSVVGSRELNQDSFLVADEKNLYAVADGVGGGLKGEVASKMAVDGLSELFTPGARLATIIHELQARVLKESMDNFGEAIMGTTLTAVQVGRNEVNIAHVGDSRCYLYFQNHLRQVTEDQEFYDESLQASVLSSYLGVPSDIHPLNVCEYTLPVTTGDRLLICSDGLYRQVVESQIVAQIRKHFGAPQELVNLLCEEASRKEYSDNVTLVYVEIQ